MELLPIRRALVSVTDKSGLEDICQTLYQGDIEIVSTGGTARKISEAGIPVTSVSDVTGFPEILNGRVKTLHPKIQAGVLADKNNPSHLTTLEEHNIKPFDLICVNLYNFALALEKGLEMNQLVEEIDIGGPTLLRAGAKNFHSILVIPDPQFYEPCMDELKNNNYHISLEFRQKTAAFAFKLVSGYDATISQALKDVNR
ncbi:MAG TPA: IMP cyclohydrolase [Desulfohalobiaceae bacterium]|nr:IMP cyclohydrolase [Desulfohalobiaceae bacterium]